MGPKPYVIASRYFADEYETVAGIAHARRVTISELQREWVVKALQDAVTTADKV